jgi:predicted alpha/beta hydrolase family esterase
MPDTTSSPPICPGTDTSPVNEVSLDDCVDLVDEAVTDADGETVLVGHSMAGMILAGVAEGSPDAVDTAVYLMAFLPESGMSLVDYAMTDEECVVTQNFQIDEEVGLATPDRRSSTSRATAS